MKSLGKIDVDYIDASYSTGQCLMTLKGSGKKIKLQLDRWSAVYMFGKLREFLAAEERAVAEMRKGLTL